MLRLGLRPDASEVQAARAAAGARIFYTLSTVSVCPIEEVARGATRQLWSQLYVLKPQLHAQRPWVVLGGWDEDACVHR